MLCHCDSVHTGSVLHHRATCIGVDFLLCSFLCVVITSGSESEITCNSQVGGHAVL